ncbi:hypothetical protein [Micromonospora chersina]|uniref:hypothetical protein n=1 Tax=Micromonospora chersina TaxID=47854 RepID=UPI0037196E8C
MSNSWAYPVLHTTDVDRALGAVDRLLEIADLRDVFLRACARVGRVSGLPRYLDAFGGVGELVVHDLSPLAEVAPRDPGDPLVDVDLHVSGLGPVAELVRVAGSDPACLTWNIWGWPEVPELGLGPDVKHGYIGLTLNATDLWGDQPTDVHTVFVHTRRHEPQRAEWLAGRVGLTVVGPGAMGF